MKLSTCTSDCTCIPQLGLTPLHIAAWKGHTSVVQMLLSHGSNPAAVAHNGKTAQQLAAGEEHTEAHTVLQAAIAKVTDAWYNSISNETSRQLHVLLEIPDSRIIVVAQRIPPQP